MDSLACQTDQEFSWVVADGGSTDGTIEMISAQAGMLRVVLDSRPDCGIYDALNRAIELADAEYYIVVGADDYLEPEAIQQFRDVALETAADLITATITVDGIVKPWKRRPEWLYGQFAHVSSHAVGLMIRKSLHESFGRYNESLRIAADQQFILSCLRGGAHLERGEFIAGDFASTGTSGSNVHLSITEGFIARISSGAFIPLQALILFMRLLRHRKKIRLAITRGAGM